MASERKRKRPNLSRRAWLRIGGLAGFVALLGLIVAFSGLIGDFVAQRSGDAAQATMIAIMDMQLDVQSELATFQASEAGTGPTATAIAQRVEQLMSTREALDALRLKIEPTLTHVVPAATGAPPPELPVERVSSQVPGITAELTEFSRFENMATVKVRYTNSGESSPRVWAITGSYLLDEATQKQYRLADQSNTGMVTVPPGGKLEVWGKYELSEEDRPRYLTVILQHGILFEHLKVP